MEPMSFGTFVWPCKPKRLQIQRKRDLKRLRLPRAGCVLQDFGPCSREVSGEGDFSGEEFQKEFAQLLELYRKGEAALLSLPGCEPFPARLQTLDCTRGPYSNLIHYSFLFWEEGSAEQRLEAPAAQTHTVSEGETLWGIAASYGTTADDLAAKNPSIRRPDRLTPGEQVRLV